MLTVLLAQTMQPAGYVGLRHVEEIAHNWEPPGTRRERESRATRTLLHPYVDDQSEREQIVRDRRHCCKCGECWYIDSRLDPAISCFLALTDFSSAQHVARLTCVLKIV